MSKEYKQTNIEPAMAAELEPYTLEELNARLDESEMQMEAGDVMSGEQVHLQMQEYLKTLRA